MPITDDEKKCLIIFLSVATAIVIIKCCCNRSSRPRGHAAVTTNPVFNNGAGEDRPLISDQSPRYDGPPRYNSPQPQVVVRSNPDNPSPAEPLLDRPPPYTEIP